MAFSDIRTIAADKKRDRPPSLVACPKNDFLTRKCSSLPTTPPSKYLANPKLWSANDFFPSGFLATTTMGHQKKSPIDLNPPSKSGKVNDARFNFIIYYFAAHSPDHRLDSHDDPPPRPPPFAKQPGERRRRIGAGGKRHRQRVRPQGEGSGVAGQGENLNMN